MPEPLLSRIPDSYETRAFAEVRADADLGTFDGHASVFWALDDHISVFAPKAFRKTIADKGGRLPVVYFHDPGAVIGPVRDLNEDKTGLAFTAQAVADNSHGSYVLAHLRAGQHMGMSFGFRTLKSRAGTDDDPIDFTTGPQGFNASDIEVKQEVELYEISVLPWAFASQPKADINSVRAKAQADALIPLLDAIRAGHLTDAEYAQIVAAWQARDGAGPSPETPTPTADPARRNRDVQIAIAAFEAEWRPIMGVQA